jgi:hypothetical protein
MKAYGKCLGQGTYLQRKKIWCMTEDLDSMILQFPVLDHVSEHWVGVLLGALLKNR